MSSGARLMRRPSRATTIQPAQMLTAVRPKSAPLAYTPAARCGSTTSTMRDCRVWCAAEPGQVFRLWRHVQIFLGRGGRSRCQLEFLFGEFAELVGHRPVRSERHRAVADRFPAEAVANAVDGAICSMTRQAAPRAGAAF